MAHADYTVVISAPIAEVFAFLADGTNNERWRPGVMDVTPPPGGPAEGTVYGQGLRGPKGERFDGDYRITEFKPPFRLAFEVIAGPARPTGVFELSQPLPGATTVRFDLDLRPRGLLWFPMKFQASQVDREMRAEVACLARLKEKLEALPASDHLEGGEATEAPDAET